MILKSVQFSGMDRYEIVDALRLGYVLESDFSDAGRFSSRFAIYSYHVLLLLHSTKIQARNRGKDRNFHS